MRMKIFAKTFYFLVFLLIVAVLFFFVISNLKSGENNEGKKLITEETAKNIILADENVKKLNIPFFKQEYIRSCEEASLRMALAFYGIETNDMEIVKKVGYDPHPWDKKNNIWDDPNEMFVGSIDDPNKNGYGVFAPAIAKAAKAFGRDAEGYRGVSAQFLAEQVYQGYPVIVWGFTAPPLTKYFWNTKEGKKITAYRGEHARVIVGVFGNPVKPTGFLVNDPLTKDGKEEYWSAEKLMANMNILGDLTNQAVVVK
jgi:uncharacterized protein YvpB